MKGQVIPWISYPTSLDGGVIHVWRHEDLLGVLFTFLLRFYREMTHLNLFMFTVVE
jgi:hypothetical protein